MVENSCLSIGNIFDSSVSISQVLLEILALFFLSKLLLCQYVVVLSTHDHFQWDGSLL